MTGRARLPSRFMARPCFKIEKAFPEPLAGVDEAGCAPLAGPVVAAAVILDRKRFPRGIDDSKALPAPVRAAICARLYKTARIGVGIASVEERSEEHTFDIPSIMRTTYDVFCLNKKTTKRLYNH